MAKDKHIYLCDGRSFKILRFTQSLLQSENEFSQPLTHPFRLEQNYPNPFNPITGIRFTVKGGQPSLPVSLEIYNILGESVRTLVDEELGSGEYEIFWDGKNESQREVASGVYFYKLKVGDFEQTRKMILMR
jgi:hypothetical protein